jgi:SAM-dependent methyltransferase
MDSMDSNDKTNYFDAHYYAHGCGEPYGRSEVWLALFNAIAGRIVQDIGPSSVMDAGCAMGLLVEALRQRGVEAFGMDISEYSISQVPADIEPYCQVGSVTEPFAQRYDLMISIEVLEHMSAVESEKAVANFCQHADDVLFSSTPFDYKEATHFNVQPPEYWAELFARHNFYRDVDFDASFITPWAARFRRRNEPPQRLIRDYERKFWLLWKENTDLRSLILEMRSDLSSARDQIEQLKTEDQPALIEKERQLQKLGATLATIQGSRGWRILETLRKLLGRTPPTNTR